jgi:hypothetical protein
MDQDTIIEPIFDAIAQNLTSEGKPELDFPMNLIMFFWRMIVQLFYFGGMFTIGTVVMTYFK